MSSKWDKLRARTERHIAGQNAIGAPTITGWLPAPIVLDLLDALDKSEAETKHLHREHDGDMKTLQARITPPREST